MGGVALRARRAGRDTAWAMSEENVEIVRRIYDEIVASPEGIRELYASDYQLDVTDIGPDIGVIRGFDAANEALRSYFETFEDFYIQHRRGGPRRRGARGDRGARWRAHAGERFRGPEPSLPCLCLP